MSIDTDLATIYNDRSGNIIGVSLGFKYINNEKTNTIAVVYFVKNKLPIDQIQHPEEPIPSSLNISGTTYPTDVIETLEPQALNCYTSSDNNVTRLQGELLPLKGGQEIIQFPTNFTNDGSSYKFSTMGMLCVDNIDNKFVGVGCAHSLLSKYIIARDDDLVAQAASQYNITDANNSFLGTNYRPSIAIWDKTSMPSVTGTIISSYVKRFSPLKNGKVNPEFSINTITEWNDIDTAVIGIGNANLPASVLLSIDSHKIYVPTNQTEYTEVMDFATTAELDNILNVSPAPLIYSTGRTTGPKGYNENCRMIISNINQYIQIIIDGKWYPFRNAIAFRYVNTSFGAPCLPGDSGSMVVAEYSGGVRKIIGMVFAGGGQLTYVCRIDDIVSALNIRKWDWTTSIDSGLLNQKLSSPTPSFLKVEIGAPNYNTVSSQQKIVVGGKTYYQSGFTKNNYTLYTG